MSIISIILIEYNALIRMILKAALHSHTALKVISEASNANQGLELIKIAPDVAVIDIDLPDMDGIELIRKIKQDQFKTKQSQTKILVLTNNCMEDVVLGAFIYGADSYYMKESSIHKLTEAIILTYHGNSWIDPTISNIVLRKFRQCISLSLPKTVEIEALSTEYKQVLETYPLTQRQLEILELIVIGFSNRQIAERLCIRVNTVEFHVRNISNKFCADNRTQIAVRALRSGLIS